MRLAGVSPELDIESETEVGTKRTGCLQIGLSSPRLADTAESGGSSRPRPGPTRLYPGRVPSFESFTGRQKAELPPPHLTRAL